MKKVKESDKNVHHTHTLTPVEIIQTSSVELKRNAKGETEIRVKVYNTDFKKAMNEANRTYITLKNKYKYGQ